MGERWARTSIESGGGGALAGEGSGFLAVLALVALEYLAHGCSPRSPPPARTDSPLRIPRPNRPAASNRADDRDGRNSIRAASRGGLRAFGGSFDFGRVGIGGFGVGVR